MRVHVGGDHDCGGDHRVAGGLGGSRVSAVKDAVAGAIDAISHPGRTVVAAEKAAKGAITKTARRATKIVKSTTAASERRVASRKKAASKTVKRAVSKTKRAVAKTKRAVGKAATRAGTAAKRAVKKVTKKSAPRSKRR